MQVKFVTKLTSREGGAFINGQRQEKLVFTGTDENAQAFNDQGETGLSNINISMVVHGDKVDEFKLGDVKQFTMDDSSVAASVPATKSATSAAPAAGGRIGQ
jgi:hypothetical protein